MRSAWEISRDMFLSEPEAEALLGFVRRDVSQAGAVPRTAVPPQPTVQLDRLIIETLLFTGLRNSEFCRLALGDLNLEPGGARLTIRQGEAVDRVVYLPSVAARLLEDYRRTTRRGLLPPDVDEADPLQPLVFHERRRPFERTGLYRRVVRILTEAGLGDRASVQLLRHTYGYLAYLRTGGNLLFTQRQLGHAHPIVTSIYAQFVDESYARLAEMLVAAPASATSPEQPLPAKVSSRKKTSPAPVPGTQT
jgi:integrase